MSDETVVPQEFFDELMADLDADTIRLRVEAGIAYLIETAEYSRDEIIERVFPQGFADLTFNMMHPMQCVLGRIFGNFVGALDELDLTHGRAVMLGFDIDQEPYEALTEAWERALLPAEFES